MSGMQSASRRVKSVHDWVSERVLLVLMTAAASNLSQRYPRKRAFITGAASGLGLACAEILAREGWQLFLNDVDLSRLSVVSERFRRDGALVTTVEGDVRESLALEQAVDEAVRQAGGIDVAVNCAGVAWAGPFHSSTEQDWRWVMDINVLGVANASRAVIRHMARGSGGLVINIASAASFCTGTHMSAYNASKAAVVALSESLMQEYAAYGVKVLVAMPGFFVTRLMETARGSEKTLSSARKLVEQADTSAEQVAEAILWAAARGDTHCVYPEKYLWLWRLKRLMPRSFQRILPKILGRQ
jgi:NAD(P)-dependent dehydrogenase (short-subunit alcohol dehydrogenase family)